MSQIVPALPPSAPRRRRNRRGVVAVAVLGLWAVGLGLLARRELFRPRAERLAEAALRVNPGAVFFAVTRGGEQIGFASSTIDTTSRDITATDYLVADLPVGGQENRAEARSVVSLSRSLRVDSFTVSFETDSIPFSARGHTLGDSVLALAIGDAQHPDTSRVQTGGPILLPTLLPLAVMLGQEPKVGGKTTVRVFDPVEQAPKNLAVEITAESLFTVSDSAKLDSTAKRWVVAHDDTVRAWRIRTDAAQPFTAWVDEHGRLVQADLPGGLALERRAYEIAFENWKLEARARGGRVTADRDILETTAIASNRLMRVNGLSVLRARLSGTDLTGFAIEGGRQHLSGDTLIVRRETAAALEPGPQVRLTGPRAVEFMNALRAEPGLPRDSAMVATARRIVGAERDTREKARLINRWVHDSLQKRTSIGIPNAATVLRTRSGDCNEHAALFTALARSVNVPTRIAAGLAYVDGKFYYHAWPEVYLRDWVAVDPTFGQFPADAGHLRFTIGGLSRQAELLRLIGTLKIDVVSAR
ncbi:MAG TPA: transglutaminase-like domain-containing protein [Gemmatimonadaceae bacterium]|nr:transglutaminase-like domain-containing protein [Gemmatimonadaceae bacterium]